MAVATRVGGEEVATRAGGEEMAQREVATAAATEAARERAAGLAGWQNLQEGWRHRIRSVMRQTLRTDCVRHIQHRSRSNWSKICPVLPDQMKGFYLDKSYKKIQEIPAANYWIRFLRASLH